MKQCFVCLVEKDESQFYVENRKSGSYRRPYCKSCEYESARKRDALNPQAKYRRQRDWDLRDAFGITLNQFEALVASQDGLCKICQLRPATTVDHNHSTGVVRGILCGPCNRGLGLFQDSAIVLQKALEYLLSDTD